MVSNKLREFRIEVGMTLSELARRCKTSRQTVTNIELYGQVPNGLLMLKISEVLKKDPKVIFFNFNAMHGLRKGEGDQNKNDSSNKGVEINA